VERRGSVGELIVEAADRACEECVEGRACETGAPPSVQRFCGRREEVEPLAWEEEDDEKSAAAVPIIFLRGFVDEEAVEALLGVGAP